jgi:hypothetical protein
METHRLRHQDFFIPVENNKNDKTHTNYLSDFALSPFQRLHSFRQSEIGWFPNTKDTGHVCEKSITKHDEIKRSKPHSRKQAETQELKAEQANA